MSQPVEQSTKSKAVKIPEDTWASVAHERIDRRSEIGDLIAVAWTLFMSLPESKREKLVRDAEQLAA